jgi:hypothetical protein
VRWDRLFADLDAQLDSAQAGELAGEVSDRSRREVARLQLADRARLATGAQLSAGVAGAGTLSGRLLRSGPGWWLLRADGGEILVNTGALVWVAGLPALAAEPEATPAVERRMGLGYVLRGIARDRTAVRVVLTDAATLTGTIDRVGADFIDLAEHAPGEARRASTVRGARTIPFSGLAAVRGG